MASDQEIISELEEEMVRAIGSLEKICAELPVVLRKALSEVVDTPRTGRVWVSELEKPRKLTSAPRSKS